MCKNIFARKKYGFDCLPNVTQLAMLLSAQQLFQDFFLASNMFIPKYIGTCDILQYSYSIAAGVTYKMGC